MECRVVEDPVTATPMVVPLGRRSRTAALPEDRMTTTETATPSVLLTDATVHSVTRLSPAFVRVELASPAFADLGEDGFDTRFKVVLPGGDRRAAADPGGGRGLVRGVAADTRRGALADADLHDPRRRARRRRGAAWSSTSSSTRTTAPATVWARLPLGARTPRPAT